MRNYHDTRGGKSIVICPTREAVPKVGQYPDPTIEVAYVIGRYPNTESVVVRLSLAEAQAMFTNGLELVEELRPKSKAERIAAITQASLLLPQKPNTTAQRSIAYWDAFKEIQRILDEEGDL